tara:strand:- start:3074 stop:3568 length:495 start_codon:yes stop_codon:yes gene_type:complete
MDKQEPKPRKPKKERIYFRVNEDGYFLFPADPYAQRLMEEKKYKHNDIVAASLSKLRTPGSNKNAHKIGGLCRKHLDSFSGYDDDHQALKRLQLESGAACEEIGLFMHGTWCTQRYPLSLSFDSLGEAEFMAAMKTICRHISEKYWPGMDPDSIEEMAERFINE